MTSASFATHAATGDPGWQRSTKQMNRQGNILSHKLINEPSSVDLVEAFKVDTDTDALALYMLQTLTCDAIANIQSLHHPSIAQYLDAFEEILRSYAKFLGKACFPNRSDKDRERKCSEGTFTKNIPPQPRFMKYSPGYLPQQISGKREPDRCNVSDDPHDFAYPVRYSSLHAFGDSRYSQSSAVCIGPSNMSPLPRARRARVDSWEFSEDVEAGDCKPHSLQHSEFDTPQVKSTGFSRDRVPLRQMSAIFRASAAGSEVRTHALLLPSSSLPVASIPSPKAASSNEPDDGSCEDMSISLSSSDPSWLCAPSPSFFPAPSFLMYSARRASSPMVDISLPLPAAEKLHIPLDDDELTWKGLEKAIFDSREQGNSDQRQNEETIYVMEPSSSTPETSLDDTTSCSESSDIATSVPRSKNASFRCQSFRPLSISPLLEHNFSATTARQATPIKNLDVSETDVSAITHGLRTTYLCSELSSQHPSSLFSHADYCSLNSKNNSLAPLFQVSLTVQGDSLFSSAPSSGAASSKDDEERSHIHAPTPIHLGSRSSLLDFPPGPQRTLDIVDRLSHFTPMPFKLSSTNILLFVENAFEQVMSTGDSAAVMQMLSGAFSLWHGEIFIPGGLGTTSVVKWNDFISQTLVMRIRREFKEIAKLTEDSFSARVTPILKFVFYLQALPSAAQKAQRALGTLVDAILHSHAGTKDSACVIAKRMNFLLDYFRPSMKGALDCSWVTAWQSLRSAGLSFIHGKLRSFVRLCIENSSRERYEKDSVLFLATFLAQLNPRKMLRKLLPIKKLVKLLNSADKATQQPCAVKAAATLLLMVCSNAETAGCIACWKFPHHKPHHWRTGVCACTAYSEWLSYELQIARSLVSHRVLDKAFESLEEMDAIEKYLSVLSTE